MDNFDLRKFVSEKTLLNESAPGYDTRKTGESLPTLESIKAAYEAKKEGITETRDLSVKEKMDNILYVMDPVQVIDELILAMSTDDANLYLDTIIQNYGIMGIDEAKKEEKSKPISLTPMQKKDFQSAIRELSKMEDFE